MKKTHARLIFVSVLLASTWVACGVKGPPLPPVSTIPQGSEEKSLGQRPAPATPIPSPSPSGT